ncbi:hypothetical protein NQ176_g10230 [Zarea fungicola]|uniref:Uncharacterized protein n=1 Tax=Zarea fungicola TaxID=93591 RepID=A0ACC1MGX6_9HYPO|nr:hypothetical protein NQ176_g10230 [Lecanicillium fungicola]
MKAFSSISLLVVIAQAFQIKQDRAAPISVGASVGASVDPLPIGAPVGALDDPSLWHYYHNVMLHISQWRNFEKYNIVDANMELVVMDMATIPLESPGQVAGIGCGDLLFDRYSQDSQRWNHVPTYSNNHKD